MPFTRLLRSGRPQVDPQAGNVTGFSCWVRELLCGQKLRLWVTSPGWFWVCSAASCAFTAGGTLACPARFSLKILAWRPRSPRVGMFVVWELHVVRACRGRGGWRSESCPNWWWLRFLWPQIAFRTWRCTVMRAEFSSGGQSFLGSSQEWWVQLSFPKQDLQRAKEKPIPLCGKVRSFMAEQGKHAGLVGRKGGKYQWHLHLIRDMRSGERDALGMGAARHLLHEDSSEWWALGKGLQYSAVLFPPLNLFQGNLSLYWCQGKR